MNHIKVPASGPASAKVMIVGEAPGADEEEKLTPFVGQSGQELTRMLAEAGISRDDCFITNVCKYRPPKNDIGEFFTTKTAAKKTGAAELWGRYPNKLVRDGIEELYSDIRALKPNLIIALGNTPLWALTGQQGITRWRGSMLKVSQSYGGAPTPTSKVIPTFHPAAILRSWKYRSTAVQDLRRCAAEKDTAEYKDPTYEFIIRPDFKTAAEVLSRLISHCNRGTTMLAVDLETRSSQIACVGIAWTHRDAVCIPILSGLNVQGYWPHHEEVTLVTLLRKLLTHPNACIVGQNFLYDAQYLAYQWGIGIKQVKHDTMLAHHLCFPDLPKGLDFLSSMYCSWHQYWKEEGKHFDLEHHDEERLWIYNCKDACATFECMGALEEIIPMEVRVPDPTADIGTVVQKPNLSAQYAEYMEVFAECFMLMMRGVRVDQEQKNAVLMDLMKFAGEYEAYFSKVPSEKTHQRGKRTAWYRSPQQCHEVFYDYCGVPIVKDRKTKRPTTNAEALRAIGQREPLLRPITDRLMQYRSMETIAEAVQSKADIDGRMRCAYNPAGTKTFRLSSGQNAWGDGCNLQNVTTGEKYEQEEWLYYPQDISFPNLRRYFVPDPGCVLLDVDLSKADANIVAAEAQDWALLDLINTPGVDLHTENAKVIFGPEKGLLHVYRQQARVGCHATNYGITIRPLARAIQCSVYEAEQFQDRWFSAHPGIHTWHQRVKRDLNATRGVMNKFGYYMHFEDRMDQIFPAALAWIPQSTVALYINKVWLALVKQLPWVQVLMQVHDSLVIQIPKAYYPRRGEIKAIADTIVVPYEQPIVIQLGCKASDKSWGDVEKVAWQ